MLSTNTALKLCVGDRLPGLDRFNSSELAVLAFLTCRLNGQKNDRLCWVSQSTIARHFGLSVRSVSRLISSLGEQGFLSIESRGAGRACAYRIIDVDGLALEIQQQCADVSQDRPGLLAAGIKDSRSTRRTSIVEDLTDGSWAE